ncbi:hypothetical protein BDV18DRAFT_47124 [Aspergillus unguis]
MHILDVWGDRRGRFDSQTCSRAEDRTGHSKSRNDDAAHSGRPSDGSRARAVDGGGQTLSVDSCLLLGHFARLVPQTKSDKSMIRRHVGSTATIVCCCCCASGPTTVVPLIVSGDLLGRLESAVTSWASSGPREGVWGEVAGVGPHFDGA